MASGNGLSFLPIRLRWPVALRLGRRAAFLARMAGKCCSEHYADLRPVLDRRWSECKERADGDLPIAGSCRHTVSQLLQHGQLGSLQRQLDFREQLSRRS